MEVVKFMKISVAMAVYNGEKYLIEQLDSIREQTRRVDEVIICDDRSNDASAEIIEGYIQQYKLGDSWSFCVNEENLGYATNFITALQKTSGDIVFFCDQDDIWILDRVEKMANLMEANEHIMMLGSEFEPFACSADAPSINKKVLHSFVNDNSLEHIRFSPKTVFIGSEGCTMCLRKSFINQTIKYWIRGWAHDEYAWKLALCLDGCYIYHATTLKRRMHSSNVSKKKMRDLKKRIQFLQDLKQSHIQTIAFAKDIELKKKQVHLLERNVKATELRIDLLEKKKYMNIVPLIFCYLDCYHSKKSIPVELYMAIHSGKN